jgi:hypothetical protein
VYAKSDAEPADIDAVTIAERELASLAGHDMVVDHHSIAAEQVTDEGAIVSDAKEEVFAAGASVDEYHIAFRAPAEDVLARQEGKLGALEPAVDHRQDN